MRIQAFLKSHIGSCMFSCKEQEAMTLQQIVSYLNEIYSSMNIIWIKIDGKKALDNRIKPDDRFVGKPVGGLK